MNDREIYWWGFWIMMTILVIYGGMLGYQRPELWIRRISLLAAPLINTTLIKVLFVDVVDPTWSIQLSTLVQLWVASVIFFLAGCSAGTFAVKVSQEETLDQLNRSRRF